MADYSPASFRFVVNFVIGGSQLSETAFQEVSGLAAELPVESLQEGGENRFVHRLPGRAKYPNLVLKRGLVADSQLIEWFEDSVASLEIEPADDLTVSLLDEAGKPVLSWNFVKPWPVKWSLSNFNAQNNALAIDTLELAYQYATTIRV